MLDFIYMVLSEVWDGAIDTLVRFKRVAAVVTEELELYSSVYIARFIVWRELRRRRREEKVLT